MDPLGIFVIGALTLGGVLFYSGSGVGIICGLAIIADLGTLGMLMNGSWPLLVIVGLPVIGLNYAAFKAITDKES